MAKGKKQKKKNMKLRRQLRKTLGCLFMVSALLVTAIPVQPMEAADAAGWNPGKLEDYWCKSESSAIPTVVGNAPVYQDETENFRFCYVDKNGKWAGNDSEKDKSAVVVYYNRDQDLQNGNLVIPSKMDAYVKFTDSGTNGTYAAANKLGKPLYYKVIEKTTTTRAGDPVLSSEDLDGDGKLNDYEESFVTQATEGFVQYSPCLQAQKSIWCPDGTDIQLYYFIGNDEGIPTAEDLKTEDDAGTKWKAVTDDNDNRIAGAEVKYIGNQYAVNNGSKWVISGLSSTEQSVFGGRGKDDSGEGTAAANIINLTIGSNLIGIGDYAFYGCTNISNINFGNGLNTLGNYSFANCRNLKTVGMDYNTNLTTLGARAFSNCDQLTAFALPTNVSTIGDFCFENCSSLKTVDMTGKTYGKDLSFSLTKIGYKAFLNCSSLQNLVLPKSYNGAEKGSTNPVFHLSTVKGCKGLKYISTPSQTLQFVTDAETRTAVPEGGSAPIDGTYDGDGKIDGDYTFDIFKAEVGDEFYFEAPGYVDASASRIKTPVHNIANLRHIAFKYLNEDRYEIVEDGYSTEATNTPDVGLVFEVNSPGDLIGFRIEDRATGLTKKVKVPEINMPEKIGPYKIVSLVQGSFDNNCYIEKVTIPASVVNIGSGTFKGSHNLKFIVFSEAANVINIGENAFATQVIDGLHGTTGMPDTCNDTGFLKANPFLSFSGRIEKDDGKNTQPFIYAMKSTSKVNAGEQPLTYITYYSGMPTNLTVKYNPDTQMSELQHFPTKEEVEEGFVAPENYEGAYTPRVPNKTGSGETATVDSYRYPYISTATSAEAEDAFKTEPPTENQANMRNGVYNIVIPNGVNSIKEGLFSGLDTSGYVLGSNKKLPEGNKDYSNPAPDVQTLTVKSVNEIKPYTFSRMPELVSAYVSGAASIGNYAFDECGKLANAEIGADTATLGLRPFSGCDALTNVTFPNSANFAADNGIIYGLKDGAKDSIVECLEGRGITIGSRVTGPDEFTGINSISPEAFMDCDSVRQVDLSTSNIKEIPLRCFAEADNLNTVSLPGTAVAIREGSFWNTKTLASVKIPDGVSVITPNAFAEVPINEDGTYGEPLKDRVNLMPFDFIANKTSVAALYADDYKYIDVKEDDSLKATYSVMLFDAVDPAKPALIKEIRVKDGENLNLTILDVPDHTADGYQFSKWWPSADIFNPIVADTEIWAMYEPIGATTYTVRFFDINKAEMKDYTQQVVSGKDAAAPPASAMEVEGKVFTGWDRALTNVTSSFDTYAQYSDREPGTYVVRFWADDAMTKMIGKAQIVKEGEAAIEPAHPTKEGYTFTGWFPSSGWEKVTKDLDVIALYKEGTGTDTPGGDNPGGDTPGGDNPGGNNGNNGNSGDSGSDSSNSNNSVSDNSTKYKVVVNGGSGSGEYTAGTIVPINAYARADDTVFDKWTSSSSGVGFVNQTAISTTFTMPSNNVEITANYKKGSGSSSVSSNSRSARRNSTTTVDVTKGGISNTGLASANVNGSSDNYVVKITEDAQATAAVIAALEAKYGDLSNIAYMPMDISLYDSTGQTKITDVSGVTVDITLPLPDDLIQYAGNNKAAGVVNGQLDELGAKFTTIDGVPCIQFTATHFSPYTIYVDKANLTEGTVDSTPKTGDPIHPKWFLAMGLACIAIILFCKKDKGQPKVKTA